MWLRPPKARPIAGSVASVSSRARYMATWRARRRGAARLGESELVQRDAERLRRLRPGSRAASAAPRAQVGVEAGEHLLGERRAVTGRPVSEP